MTLLFVHGTGTRVASLQETLAVVEERAKQMRPGIKVVGCYWADISGIPEFKGLSLPTPRKPKKAADSVAEYWSMLAADPLFELKLWCTADGSGKSSGLGQPPGVVVWEETLRDYKPSGALAHLLAGAGGAAAFTTAWGDLMDTGVPEKAVTEALEEDLSGVCRSLAESVLAQVAAAQPGLTRETRTQAVARLMVEWNQQYKDISGIFMKFFGWTEKKLLRPARGPLSEMIAPAIGDILRYQSMRKNAHETIGEAIGKVKDDVYVLAHSLGGIACVELLWKHAMGVKGLITAGSQAPMLAEFDALETMQFKGTPLKPPAHFPPWLNLYDGNDVLSYRAEPIFEHVTDFDVDSVLPFWQAHSAYWKQDETWEQIGKFIAAHP